MDSYLEGKIASGRGTRANIWFEARISDYRFSARVYELRERRK